jgi:hypothetical protein
MGDDAHRIADVRRRWTGRRRWRVFGFELTTFVRTWNYVVGGRQSARLAGAAAASTSSRSGSVS